MRGALGESGQGRHGGGQLSHVVEVDVDAAQFLRAADGQDTIGESDVGPHRGEDPADRVAGLRRRRRPHRDADGSAGHCGSGQERCGVGEIGFDRPVHGAHRPRCHTPGVRVTARGWRRHGNSGLAEHLDGHVDVWHGRDGLAVVVNGDTLFERSSREQETGDELRRTGCIDGDRPAA